VGGGVQRRRGCSGGRQCARRGPAAPVREGEAGVSSNLGVAKLGRRSPERGKAAAALGEIRREGEASGGRRRRTGVETVGREAALERGAGAGSVSREWAWSRFELLGRWRDRGGKRRERGVGPLAVGVPRGAGRHRGAWPRPAGGAPTVSRSAVTRTRRASLFRQRRVGADVGGPRW
jgi:hypothetical protein